MRKLKGFTLVEILIVIVIIGILIGALVPRMQSAQGRARDVARKNDLSQLQSAILVSFQDKGDWPLIDNAYGDAQAISAMGEQLLAAGMNGVPADPLKGSTFKGLGSGESTAGQYMYMVVDSYGSKKGGFVLMAKTEVEGGSNWVVCDNGDDKDVDCIGENKDECESSDGDGTSCKWEDNQCTGKYKAAQGEQGMIKKDGERIPDIKDIKPCTTLNKTATTDKCTNSAGACTYSNESQLRYILIN